MKQAPAPLFRARRVNFVILFSQQFSALQLILFCESVRKILSFRPAVKIMIFRNVRTNSYVPTLFRCLVYVSGLNVV